MSRVLPLFAPCALPQKCWAAMHCKVKAQLTLLSRPVPVTCSCTPSHLQTCGERPAAPPWPLLALTQSFGRRLGHSCCQPGWVAPLSAGKETRYRQMAGSQAMQSLVLLTPQTASAGSATLVGHNEPVALWPDHNAVTRLSLGSWMQHALLTRPTCSVLASMVLSRRSALTRALTYSPREASVDCTRPPSNRRITPSASPLALRSRRCCACSTAWRPSVWGDRMRPCGMRP